MSTIIGIDLGTSTTEAAIYRNGVVEMILNLDQEIITPSAVGVDDNGEWVVGKRAMSQLILSPQNTAIEVKRKIGTGDFISVGGRPYSPVELSAKLLSYVRKYASDYLGEDVSHAVISVPAYFNEKQRQETIAAGTQAGLTVERILNEPTAAALSYGLAHMEEESHILVYDLGGGTFDVTLLEMFGGILEVKASAGDNQLGGKDFDEAIMNSLIKGFEKKHGINLRNLRQAMVKLKDEAERCKKALSTEDSYRVLIPAIAKVGGQPVELDVTLTRKDFEALVKPLVARTHKPIDVVLSDSGITANRIDKIILVGGSTRMPMIAADIEAYLGKTPDVAVNPDYAVSEGAAIQAAIMAGIIDPSEGLIMTDVNSYSLGVRCLNDGNYDYFSVIIPRNVTIPVSKTERYYTSYYGQTRVNIEIYQGENPNASRNHPLGEFFLDGIPANKATAESIDITFSYNMNGMLDITAKVVSTGKDATISINMQKQDEAPILSYEEDEEEASVSYDDWKESPISDAYRAIIRRAERVLKRLKDEDTIEEINDLLDDLKEAICKEDEADADDYEDELAGLLESLED
ncbi:MAG: Hsp70 family protein [Clostridia bacterium]|nr:Hsp70 family protein [Clostridia bacterium]